MFSFMLISFRIISLTRKLFLLFYFTKLGTFFIIAFVLTSSEWNCIISVQCVNHKIYIKIKYKKRSRICFSLHFLYLFLIFNTMQGLEGKHIFVVKYCTVSIASPGQVELSVINFFFIHDIYGMVYGV